MSAWISVNDRLPQHYECVLVWFGDYEFATYQVHDGGTDGRKAGRWYQDDELYGVTHWMPLPEPPK